MNTMYCYTPFSQWFRLVDNTYATFFIYCKNETLIVWKVLPLYHMQKVKTTGKGNCEIPFIQNLKLRLVFDFYIIFCMEIWVYIVFKGQILTFHIYAFRIATLHRDLVSS